MLTGDLVRVRKKDGRVVPAYVRGAAVERLLPIAEEYAYAFGGLVGSTRDEVDAALGAIDVGARDRVAALGLKKLLEDRAEFEVASAADPEPLRRAVFLASTRAHQALDVRGEFDRAAVLAEVASERETTPEAIDAGLYADLRGSELLQKFEPVSPAELLERYNLALAQAVLFKAIEVRVTIGGEEPARVRALFRAARFHGLLHSVTTLPDERTKIVLDGPFALFEASQRYGLKLAVFLPHVVALKSFSLEADLRWGKERAPAAFTLGPEDGLVARVPDPPSLSPELEVFAAAFERLGSSWKVLPNERVFAEPGQPVCVPDLVFENAATGEVVFLEAFGFWSRAAVWRRVEQLRAGFPARVILAVGKHLRVSQDVLEESDDGEVYVYKQTLSPRAVLSRLERSPSTTA